MFIPKGPVLVVLRGQGTLIRTENGALIALKAMLYPIPSFSATSADDKVSWSYCTVYAVRAAWLRSGTRVGLFWNPKHRRNENLQREAAPLFCLEGPTATLLELHSTPS